MKPEILQALIGLLVASILIFTLLGTGLSAAKRHKKVNLLYILLAGLFIGITGLVQYFGLSGKPFVFLIILQVLILILGILHAWLMPRLLKWPAKGSFSGEFLLTLNTAAIGGVFLLLAFTLVGMKNFGIIMLSALIWFLVPILFIKAVEFYNLIPARIFRTWSYPIDKQIPDPTDSELASPMVISFEFQKKVDEPDYTIFRAKAPKDIGFGKLFYFFINDYNSRHPEGTIEVASRSNMVYPWVFHFKPKWFAKTRYLDPEETVYHNQIKENSIIVCHRILNNN